MNNTPDLAILKHMAALADPSRRRLLRLLKAQEMTVSELCGILQLPQSTVSRHLKTLSDDGWVSSRRDGASRFYSMATEGGKSGAAKLWALVEEQVAESGIAHQDNRRLEQVLARRRSRSQEFFGSAAGQSDRLRSELFGHQFRFHALLGLLDNRWDVGDLGCGTGQMTELLAPFVHQVIAVDGSPEMLAAARGRLENMSNVDLRQGELEALPLESGSLDAVLLILVLHYVPNPGRAIAEAARVLKSGGRLLLVDMLSHDQEELRRRMGHLWLGFGEDQIERYLAAAGLDEARIWPLPSDANAQGPALFTAAGRKGA